MSNKSEIVITNKSIPGNIISWLFGMVVLAIGLINSFWGNDPAFGVFLVLLSFFYFPTVNAVINALIKKWFGFAIPTIVKIILGVLIIWAALGVGELFNKIELMITGS